VCLSNPCCPAGGVTAEHKGLPFQRQCDVVISLGCAKLKLELFNGNCTYGEAEEYYEVLRHVRESFPA